VAKVRFSKRAKGVVSLIVGAICLLVAGILLNRAYAVANGKEVEGRVMAVEGSAVQVRYPGLTRPGTKTFDLGDEAKGLRRGRRLTVVVVSDEEAYLLGQGPSAIPIVALCLLAVALIGGGAIAVVRPG
jgi:putative intracellular protease/amidase